MKTTGLESELGYSKDDYKNKNTDNSGNGHWKKTVQGSFGELEIDILQTWEVTEQIKKRLGEDWA